MTDVVSFTRMQDGTAEDYELLGPHRGRRDRRSPTACWAGC